MLLGTSPCALGRASQSEWNAGEPAHRRPQCLFLFTGRVVVVVSAGLSHECVWVFFLRVRCLVLLVLPSKTVLWNYEEVLSALHVEGKGAVLCYLAGHAHRGGYKVHDGVGAHSCGRLSVHHSPAFAASHCWGVRRGVCLRAMYSQRHNLFPLYS